MAAACDQKRPWRPSPWRILLWAFPTGLLISPAVAMQFSQEVRWGPFDFALAFVLLFGTTGLIDLAIRKGGTTAYRFGAGLALLTALLLVWINGAVGIIGNEDNPANLVFLGVILIAATGSTLARFKARGMSRAMLVAAIAQAAIAAFVPIKAWGAGDVAGMIGLTMLIGIFAVLWGLSAALFARAANDRERLGRGPAVRDS